MRGVRSTFPWSEEVPDFEEAVWEEVSRIPFGETRAYGQVAEAIGCPGEAIEVGSACSANPVLLVVPVTGWWVRTARSRDTQGAYL